MFTPTGQGSPLDVNIWRLQTSDSDDYVPGLWGLIALVRIMYKFMSPFILPTYKLAELNSKHVDKGDGNVDIIE